VTTVAISTTTGPDSEYAQAVRAAGAEPRLLRFDPRTLEDQLAGVDGILLTGGGDVDPRFYGVVTDLAAEIDPLRDTFEIALARHARERGMPTLCICRGLQLANVAFGGTLCTDIEAEYGRPTAELHRVEIDGKSVRGIIPGHDVEIEPGSRLAAIVGSSPLATGSRHHQSVARVAPELRVVAATHDGIVEAAEARFPSPFWLAVQWHPESTLMLDAGASRAIFAAFVEVAAGLGVTSRRRRL
jgi:putative glutamine amidotransferase